MKYAITLALVVSVSVLISLPVYSQGQDVKNDQGYFGQPTPGTTPVVFAPEVVSVTGRHEFGISFSPAFDAMYFSAKQPDKPTQIYYSEREDNQWSPIQRANFTRDTKDTEMKPFVSLTENKLYFTAYNAATRNTKIWFVTATANGWSEAQQLDSPINSDRVFYLNQGTQGDIYFTNIAKRKMFYAPNKNGSYPEIKPLAIEFGTQGFIAPSQDYMVVNARHHPDSDRRDNDLFVIFKHLDDSWSTPINLGESINTKYGEAVPSITPDGKYLFFSRYDETGLFSNFYWVSTEIIARLKEKHHW